MSCARSTTLNLLLSRRVDGIIAAATSEQWATLEILEALNIPIVFIDRTFVGIKGPFVGVDNTAATYQAVHHLIEDGHHAIGILAGMERMSTMQERYQGYLRALHDHSIDPLPQWYTESCPTTCPAVPLTASCQEDRRCVDYHAPTRPRHKRLRHD